MRNADGSFAPWRSPNGTALALAAAWPRWPWTDLTRALMPNGRWRDYGKSNGGQSRTPIGVQIQSYENGLFAIRGTDAPIGDRTADLRSWKALADKGEPYDTKAAAPLQELSTFHSGAGLLDVAAAGFTAAPLLLQGGFTDELFPAQETLDTYNRLRKLKATANVALQLGDLGHSKGANKVDPDKYMNDQGAAFFAANLRAPVGLHAGDRLGHRLHADLPACEGLQALRGQELEGAASGRAALRRSQGAAGRLQGRRRQAGDRPRSAQDNRPVRDLRGH